MSSAVDHAAIRQIVDDGLRRNEERLREAVAVAFNQHQQLMQPIEIELPEVNIDVNDIEVLVEERRGRAGWIFLSLLGLFVAAVLLGRWLTKEV